MKQAIDVDLKIRPYAGEEDVPVIVGILNAELEADAVPNRESLDDYLSFVRHANQNFDATRDLAIAEVDGEPIGFTEQSWVDTSDGLYREYRLHGGVRPDWRRRGVGTALLRDNERRARLLSATHDTPLERRLGSWSNERQAGTTALLQANGYETVRWFFDMTRDLGEPISDVPLPDGLEIRPVTSDVIHQVWRADVEAFKDHWGGFDDSDENLQRWLDSPTFDPSLWIVAWDGDEVAAGNINGIQPEENAALGIKRGWLHSVFTRRQWRKRGLANALIARSLLLLKERGMDYGVLGVDADNPTGALGLYERNGFKASERSTAWRKPL